MAARIDTQTQRQKLQQRREPYWRKITKGQYLGFRKTATGGNWIARLTLDNHAKNYHALGPGPSFDQPEEEQNGVLTYDAAFKAALAWFATVEGETEIGYTIKQCVKDYAAHLLVEKGKDPSTRGKQLLEKHLVPKLGDIQLHALTTDKLKTWRDGLVRVSDDAEDVRKSKDSANRILSQTKAAFNLAYHTGRVNSDTAWKRLQTFKSVGVARTLFLSVKQVKRLLDNAEGQIFNLSKAAVLTGARYGELAGALVKDFDKTHHTLRLSGKTGERIADLSDEATRFFKDLTKDRLPDAWLLVKDDGERWGTSHHSRDFRALVQKAKLPADTVFYSLRHYYISKALLAGIPAQVVAENCGTSIRMIEKHYGKFMPSDRRAMLNQVVVL